MEDVPAKRTCFVPKKLIASSLPSVSFDVNDLVAITPNHFC